MTVGLSFIFRDNAPTISWMMSSSFKWCDQIVALDTGSVDGSRQRVEAALEIMAARGVRIDLGDFKWRDDFAAARTAADDLLDTDWSFHLDADELLVGGEHLRPVLGICDAHDLDYVGVPFSSPYVADGATTRLRRRSVGWGWQSPIHEACVPSRPVRGVQCVAPVIEHMRTGQHTDTTRNVRISLLHTEGRPIDECHPRCFAQLEQRAEITEPWNAWYLAQHTLLSSEDVEALHEAMVPA